MVALLLKLRIYSSIVAVQSLKTRLETLTTAKQGVHLENCQQPIRGVPPRTKIFGMVAGNSPKAFPLSPPPPYEEAVQVQLPAPSFFWQVVCSKAA